MDYLVKLNSKGENIQTALSLLNELGIHNAEYSGYCESNGVSVYFSHPKLMNGCKIRVSDHGISNPARMDTEICFSFDKKQFGGLVKSNMKINKMIASRLKF